MLGVRTLAFKWSGQINQLRYGGSTLTKTFIKLLPDPLQMGQQDRCREHRLRGEAIQSPLSPGRLHVRRGGPLPLCILLHRLLLSKICRIPICCEQCDQIGQFIGLGQLFKDFGNN